VNLIYYVFTTITNALQNGINFLRAASDIVWNWMLSEAERVGSWITTGVDWLWSNIVVPALAFLQTAIDYVGSALSFAIQAVVNNLANIWDNYIVPVFDWVAHAAETVAGWIYNAVQAFYHDVILPVFAFLDQLGHDFYSLLGYVLNDVVAIVNAVVKAWDWIIWFGEHGFAEIIGLLSGTDHSLTRDWLLGAAQHGNGVADEVAQWLEEMFS